MLFELANEGTETKLLVDSKKLLEDVTVNTYCFLLQLTDLPQEQPS